MDQNELQAAFGNPCVSTSPSPGRGPHITPEALARAKARPLVPPGLPGVTIEVSNEEFIKALFGDDWYSVHVTGFDDDPSNITPDRRGICWSGGWYVDYRERMKGQQNQYFCISQFDPLDQEDGTSRAVRRKGHFRATCVIVADDVKDKVPEAQAKLLPPPSWRLETSPGNEQWGWILQDPETNRARVENLLDGLVAQGLAPDGTDPGMKGVTRYVRLPEGWNTKAKYGAPFKCRMLEWRPDRMVDIEELAGPFDVDLNASRSDMSTGAVAGIWPNEAPVMEWLNEGNVISEKSEGEYLIICPWVHEHTDGDESGTWLRTIEDGSGEFKCHHGHCQERGFNDFLVETGLRNRHDTWRAFRDVPQARADSVQQPTDRVSPPVPPDFLQSVEQSALPGVQEIVGPAWQPAIDALPPDPRDNMHQVRQVCEAIAKLSNLERGGATTALKARCKGFIPAKDIDGEIQHAVAAAARAQTSQPVGEMSPDAVLNDHIFIAEVNKYYRIQDGALMAPAAFDSEYAHLDFWGEPMGELGIPERLSASEAFDKREHKKRAAGLGWFPTPAEIFELGGKRLANMYRPPLLEPIPGDVSKWITLVKGICGEHWMIVVKHMAFTIQRPEIKIRWQILNYGKPRIGKTSWVTPLLRILGPAGKSIQAEDLEGGGWGDYFVGTKAVALEEVYQPGNKNFYNGLKTKLANDQLESLNVKKGTIIWQQNLYSMYLFSNHENALHFEEDDDKLFVIRSDHPIPLPEDERKQFFTDYYAWLDHGGLNAIYDFLLRVDTTDDDYGGVHAPFHPGVLPYQTDAYMTMCRESRPDYQRALTDMIENNEGPFAFPGVTFKAVRSALTLSGYQKRGDQGIKETLTRHGFKNVRGKRRVDGREQATPWFWTRDPITEATPGAIYDWYQTPGRVSVGLPGLG